mgnify:CR=1 FL=1
MDKLPTQESIINEPSKQIEKVPFWQSLWGEIIQTLLMAAVLYFAIDAVFERVMVLNISMQPTLYEGNLILVNRLAYKLGEMETGDIVIFHNPNSLEEDFIKRLIGTPGDVVTVMGGKVSVNGTILDEPYISSPPEYVGTWEVPNDAVFVLGDNRNSSYDSHSWGYLPTKDVVGKALVVYWPFDSIKVIRHPDYNIPQS